MPSRTLYLIDGHAQIYRAYYAPFPPLTSPAGEPTKAIHVFLQMLVTLIRQRRPDYLAMVMDVSDETVFRVEIAPAYKANRPPPPEDLPPQIERIVEILERMRIPILRLRGFEADDIIATICERHAGSDVDVFIVSRDKDLDQLLDEHVKMYDPAKDRVIDVAAMIEEKGYGPEQAVEAQMLMGDSTDNVMGVRGVGPRKAAQLLKEYGSVAEIIARAEELTPKLRESVLEFAARQETVRRLVTLRRDVPIPFELSGADVSRFRLSAARPLLVELGMNRILEQLSVAGARDGPAGDAEGRESTATPEVKDAAEGSDFPVEPLPAPELFMSAARSGGRYELIDTEEALAGLAKRLSGVGAFAFDTETTGLVPAAAKLAGVSVSFQPGSGAYVAVRGVGRTVSEEALRRHLGPIFADPSIRKCGQNVKYDVVALKTCGIEVRGVDFDSMIASYVLDSSRRSHGLDALAMELLKYRPIPIEELIGRGRNQITIDQVPTQRVCEYAAEDADVVLRLRQVLERQFTDPELLRLFNEVEMPLVEVLADMEFRGVALDTDLLAELSNQMADRLGELRERIHAAAGRPFNIDSTRQLAEVLFDVRKLPVIKHTKTSRSTDAEVLERLAVETNDPIPRLLLEYRELAKLKSTYVDALPELVNPRTGRVHPSFHQTGAVTGRLSCSDPNLQNIPVRTELGARIRRAFVPGPPGWVILKADYSQIELRVLAHFSRDENLRSAFLDDRDIHAYVAAQLAGIPIEKVDKEQRARAKTVNFGIIYGQSAFGLSRQTGMSLGEARGFIERYFRRYPRIREFLDECIDHARRHGYVKTILGRRRAIPDVRSRNPSARSAAERLAINTVVQGSAADLIKKAMINIHRRIGAEKLSARMLIQVHDELVFELPAERAQTEAAMISREMAGALELDVPIRVDVARGPNWLDVESAPGCPRPGSVPRR